MEIEEIWTFERKIVFCLLIFAHCCDVQLCGLVGEEFDTSLWFSRGIKILVVFFSFSPPNIHVIVENILK